MKEHQNSDIHRSFSQRSSTLQIYSSRLYCAELRGDFRSATIFFIALLVVKLQGVEVCERMLVFFVAEILGSGSAAAKSG